MSHCRKLSLYAEKLNLIWHDEKRSKRFFLQKAQLRVGICLKMSLCCNYHSRFVGSVAAMSWLDLGGDPDSYTDVDKRVFDVHLKRSFRSSGLQWWLYVFGVGILYWPVSPRWLLWQSPLDGASSCLPHTGWYLSFIDLLTLIFQRLNWPLTSQRPADLWPSKDLLTFDLPKTCWPLTFKRLADFDPHDAEPACSLL